MLTRPSLTLKRWIKAQPAQVWAAWTDPEKIVRWFGPGETVTGTVRAVLDVRVGGSFQLDFVTDDGEKHRVGGTYREVAPFSRLAFTWAWHTTPERESRVIISITPDGDGSILTLHHEQFFDEKARDGHERGWTGTLEKLDRYLSA